MVERTITSEEKEPYLQLKFEQLSGRRNMIPFQANWISCIFFLVSYLGSAESKSKNDKFVVVDLSHAFNNSTHYWPTERANRFKFTSRVSVQTKNYHYEANSFSTAEHGGTHIDAPRHFFKGGNGVASIPMDNLVAKGIVVDVESKTKGNPDYIVAPPDFIAWESEHGTMEEGVIVLLNTGWGKKWHNTSLYFGTSTTNVSLLHFPGLSEAGAIWLTDKRKVKAVGIDTASIDFGQSTLFTTHQALSSRNIPAFENVANVHTLPPKGFHVVALPMKISEGSGAPLRIVALVGDVISAGHSLSTARALSVVGAVLTIAFQFIR